ncbi:hypothetical protein QAD02_014134 [Eretmocerus hayati]|uniref:Uncharacterized protein n=2 Tax=Eretmocerus hayati TaxID=131215 RepID=A0ACC2P4Q0_9HYME|nr:hypothetical protein QAD02_002443 [Eretmocerus hayati]KAJ8678347.1 hypothetical protein QAD02_014134 [Eretmocerus hayati]
MEASGSQENVNTPDHSVLDTLIDLLPFEMNVPGYRFLGPGTKLAERLERGEVGVCPLDDYAREHDIAYANKNADRRKADRVLAERAFSRMLASQVDPDERTLALMTACCMVSKITFEKLFSRITKAITGNKKKNQAKKKKEPTKTPADTDGKKKKKEKK